MNRILKDLEIKIRTKWHSNLRNEGVDFPSGKKLIELICLYAKMPKPMTQDEIERWHSENNFEYKRQARHLADLGWYIKSGNKRFTRGIYEKKFRNNQMSLHSIEEPNPVWTKNSIKRENNLTNEDWQKILEKFKERGCAVCGRKMNHYDKGHLLKSKSYEIGNIVPMCVDCNNWGQEIEFKEYKGLVFRPILKSRK